MVNTQEMKRRMKQLFRRSLSWELVLRAQVKIEVERCVFFMCEVQQPSDKYNYNI